MSNGRVLVVSTLVVLFFFVLVFQLFKIQVLKHEEYTYKAQRQQMSTERIRPERGLIFDRNNLLLVYNKNDISFYVDIKLANKNRKFKVKEKIARKFSEVFGKSQTYYLSLMQTEKKHICLMEKVSSEKALLLKNFRAAGLYSTEDPSRIYPYENLASHVLGYINTEYSGTNGIERAYDDILKGEEGLRLVEKNALGETILVSEEEAKPAVPGDNLFLTINKSYQSIIEEELDNGLTKYGGTSAVGIIMDPNTGEILALANKKDYNPNSYSKFSDDDRRNRSVTDTYEPGSTFKAITIASLLDQNLCRLDETINVENGTYKFKNVYIRDSHNNNKLTVKGVIEESSNIGISKLVQRIDDELYYKYVRGFGFGNYTASKLPGEAKGSLKKPNNWTSLTKTFVSFGYEISVTPLQLAAAYSAIINGGILYEPLLVKKQIKRNGVVVTESMPKQVRRVISEETSHTMRELLAAVVERGTGKNAAISTVRVGGKTGTSQKLIDGSYSKAEYNSSFIGFFPVENPKVVCLVLVNSPTLGRYGGAVAAPIFKEVAKRIVDSDVNKFLKKETTNYEIKYAVNQSDDKNDIKIKHTNNLAKPFTSAKNILKNKMMPDLTNHSLRDGILLLTQLGINYEVIGSGKIVNQSVEPGTRLHEGMKCRLDCKEISVDGTEVY
ncbi:MAG: transpeptidase family protein [Ignavibacteriaceae bacterium]|nr:transpeptidase family protein [Ignavibacteriaceae bacterium]